MSIEVDVLVETYSTLKQYISQKDRQEASDNLMSILVDYLGDKELKEFGGADSYTKRSLEEYAGGDDDEEDYTLVQPMLFRRETGIIKTCTDIAPTEDDVVVSDGVRLRLMLARIKALNKYNEIHGG